MKCPSCGKWNRASLPSCFYCGAILANNEDTGNEADGGWQQKLDHMAPSKVYIQVDEEGNQTSAVDSRDSLAREMKDFQKRQHRGIEARENLIRAGAEQGYAPSARNLRTNTAGSTMSDRPWDLYEGRPGEEQTDIEYDDLKNVNYYSGDAMPLTPDTVPGVSIRRHGGVRLIRVLAIILICAAVVVSAGYYLLVYARKNRELPLQERVIISASLMDDMAAHTILIPGEEGQMIWIREMKQDYEVIGGYATVQISDSHWYADEEGEKKEQVDVTLTPYLRTKAGEQQPMGEIRYTVDVPLAPLILITPTELYTETTSDTYTIKFKVDRNSTVYINNENYTSFVNNQDDGTVSLNATISARGINEFHIVTNCQYYRQNEMTVQIYRAPVSIEVHLDTTMSDRWSRETMTISGTTLAGANLIVLSPYRNLNLSKMESVGEFSFDAVFETIGNNEIKIQVTYPGMEPSIYTRTVYYLPGATEYSKKAWSMNRSYDYSDYLNLTELRVSKTQVYVCRGVFTEIISDSPQLAIMELSDTAQENGGVPRTVLLENKSTDTWQLGKLYRIYADAYGTYNSMPRLTARYTYDVP